MKYFTEIVGLRIYLALWVAVGHGLQLAGFLAPTNLLMDILLSGSDAVAVFMIVSGFVITNLLLSKQESYARYSTRRFFRLYPAYVVCCIIGYFLADDWVRIVDEAPWRAMEGWANYAAGVHELRDEVTLRLAPHIALHATMLHGLVPVEVLNRAAMTFVPAAWSISLEWQFYLVAPLVLIAVRRPATLAAAALIAMLVHYAYYHGWFGSYNIGSMLAGATPWFAIGIASRLSYDRLAALTVSPAAAAAVATFALLTLTNRWMPTLVWCVFYSYCLWGRHGGVDGRLFRLAFTSRPAMLLGEASYSLYLIHRPMQVLLGALALGTIATDRTSMLTIQFAAIALALPLSVAMYFFIERPGVRMGATVARRLPGAGAPARPSPAPSSV